MPTQIIPKVTAIGIKFSLETFEYELHIKTADKSYVVFLPDDIKWQIPIRQKEVTTKELIDGED